MDAFMGDYKDAVKYYDKEQGEKRIKVYVNDELEGTYYTAIVLGIPTDDEAVNKDDLEMHTLILGTFGIDVYLAAQRLFNETINREIEQCIMDVSNNFAKKHGKNAELLEREALEILREMKKRIMSKADEPLI